MLRRLLLLLIVCPFSVLGMAQGALTLEELKRLLDSASRHEILQSDIASEVNTRGIAFQLSDPIIAELRRAGAKTILIEALKRASTSPETILQQREGDESALIERLPFLEQARHYVLSNAEEIPNFIVRQTVKRYNRDRSGRWTQHDVLELDVTYEAGKGESYKTISVNGRPSSTHLESIDGATSTGEFATVLIAVFAPRSQTIFKKGPEETIAGRPAVIYDFKIRREHSANSITETRSGRSVVAGYSGSLWIDRETKRVLRLEQSVDDVPAGFPINVAELAVDYGLVEINSQKYMLPIRSEVILGSDRDNYYSRNTIEFTNYRKFDTDIKIDAAGDED